MTPQEIFDTVVTHLRSMPRQSKNNYGPCKYRSFDGLKCAVGCLIPDELYTPKMEGGDVESLYDNFDLPHEEHLSLLLRLQAMHDEKFYWGDNGLNSKGELEIKYIAKHFNLVYTPHQEGAQA